MGWTSYFATHYKNGKIDKKAELDEEFSSRNQKILKSQMVGSTYFAAIQNESTKETWAAIILTRMQNGEFFYKDMDETVGPYNYNCPKAILKLLSPTKNKLANEWREKCYEYHKQQAEKKNAFSYRKAAKGTKILWKTPFDLKSGKNKGDEILLEKRWADGIKGYFSDGRYKYGYRLLESGSCTIA